MTREWRPGDRALLPVVVDAVDVGMDRVVRVSLTGTPYTADIDPEDLIPDDRRPSWLPGQPGDVIECGNRRYVCVRRNEYGTPRWMPTDTATAGYHFSDDDVPADAVLVLPARTRGVES